MSAKAERINEPSMLGGEPLDTTMEQIVSAVVNKLSTSLQTLCVSERVVAAQQTAHDWKELCKMMIANPEIKFSAIPYISSIITTLEIYDHV